MEIQMPYIVYAQPDSRNYITAVNSSAFLTDTEGWVEIDRGAGDKYHHAQGNYFPRSVRTESGVFRYKLADGVPVECSPEELTEQEAANQAAPALPQEQRISALEAQNELLIQCILELSEVIYA